jgi:hypothetical protein
MKWVLHVSQGQKKPHIHHIRQTDNFGAGLKGAKRAALENAARPGDRPVPRENFALTRPFSVLENHSPLTS